MMNNTTDTFSTLDEINNSYTRAYIPAIVCFTIVIFSGFVSNLFAFLFYTYKERKSVFNYFISILSLNDALTDIVLIHDVVELFHYVEYKSLAVCKLFAFLKHFLVANSLILILAIALDRYRLVCHSFKKPLTRRQAKYIVLGSLISSLSISVHYFATSGVITSNFHTDTGVAVVGYYCTLYKDQPFKTIKYVFHWIDICMHVSSIVCMTVVYILIIKKVWHTKHKLNSHNKLRSQKNKTLNDNMAQTDSTVLSVDIKDGNETNERSIRSNRKTQPVPHTVEDPHAACNLKYTERTKKRTKGRLSVLQLTGQEIKLSLMAFAITVASVVCFVPYYVSMVLIERNMNGTSLMFTVGEIIAIRSYILNSVVNPFIMICFNASFRQYVFSSLYCIFCRVCCVKHYLN